MLVVSNFSAYGRGIERGCHLQKETFIKQYAAGLNPQQLAAVQAVHGPLLLLAVPGSGKTTVLVTRLGYMVLCCDVPPAQILTMTYTVAATHEMRGRFAARFGAELAGQMTFRTINGLSAVILQYYSRVYGRRQPALLTNEGDITRMLDANNVAGQIGEMGRLDLGGGGTIAKYVANRGIKVLDMGVPVLSMHSPFEVIHKTDLYMAYRTFSVFCQSAD